MLQQSGLNRYVSPKVLQKELAEATDMTQEELDRAAYEYMTRPDERSRYGRSNGYQQDGHVPQGRQPPGGRGGGNWRGNMYPS